MRPLTALLLAGGRSSLPLRMMAGTPFRPLLPLQGKTLLRRVLEACTSCPGVERAVLVAPEAAWGEGRCAGVETMLPPGRHLSETLFNGLSSCSPDLGVLVLAADLPYLTTQALESFLSNVHEDADVAYPVTGLHSYRQLFPDSLEMPVPFADGRFMTGGAFFLKPAALNECKALVKRLLRARKNPLALAALLGADIPWLLVTRRLCISDVCARIRDLTGLSVQVVEADPRLCFDLDTPVDYWWALRHPPSDTASPTAHSRPTSAAHSSNASQPLAPTDQSLPSHGMSSPSIYLRYIGNATTLIELDGVRFLTDPWFEAKIGIFTRRRPAVCRVEDLPPPDALLISHSHHDHLHLPTLLSLPWKPPLLLHHSLLSAAHAAGYKRVLPMERWCRERLGHVEVQAVPAPHLARGSLGYLLKGSRVIYFAGDLAPWGRYSKIFSHFPPLDLAILPLGGLRNFPPLRNHINAREAAHLLSLLRPRVVVPIHWGHTPRPIFSGCEDQGEDLKKWAERLGLSTEIRILREGEDLVL